MKHYGLIGRTLTHSFSKDYFANKFQLLGITSATYELYPIPSINHLPNLIDTNHLDGLNVTIPYKKEVLPYLTSLTPEASQIGAVNTIKILRSPQGLQLIGHNTDAEGFRASLLHLIGSARPQALILGTGGASQAVAYVLQQLGITYTHVSRSAAPSRLTYSDLNKQIILAHPLIINATPLGTFPCTDQFPPIPYHLLSPQHFLFDLVYNPALTLFLSKGKAQGAATQNGYEMLSLQAEASWRFWNE